MSRILILGALLMGLAAATASSAALREPGLVAYYPLNSGSGSVARDLSGNGNHGKIVGATWERLRKSYVLAFDGEDDHVFCGAPASLDLRGPLTLSAWVLPEEVPGGEVGILGKQFSSYLLTYYKTREVYTYIGEGANNLKSRIGVGMWNYIVSTFDGETMQLYMNGRRVGERVSKHKRTPPGKNFVIGCVVGDVDADDPNYTRSGFFKGMIAEVKVYSRTLSAEEVKEQFMTLGKKRFAASSAEASPVKEVAAISAEGIRVRAGKAGILQVDAGNGFFVVESAFSHPGETIGHNRLARDLEGCESSWRPQVKATLDNELNILAGGRHYGLARSVKISNGRLEFEDTVRNLTDEPLGIIINHRIITPKTFSCSRLAYGSDDPAVFVGTPDYDLGILVEDDVARTQLTPLCMLNQAVVQLSQFALDGGKSYTFKWAIYPLPPTGDAFVFINRVREDWGVNHTILGPCSFFAINWKLLDDPEGLKKYLKRKNLGVVMTSTWLDYDPGALSYTPSREEYKRRMQHAYRAFKAADPDIKVLGSIECDWVGIFPDKIKNGDRLPGHKGGRSGAVRTTRAQTKILMEAGLPWQDSMKVGKDGHRLLEVYTRRGKPQLALGVYPAAGNYHAKFLMEQAHFLAHEVGLDGFYIDEFSLYWVTSYDRWDGHTVDIDVRTGKIIRKYTDASLAGIQPRLDLCKFAKFYNLVMVGNTYATTVAESRLPVMRFSETWSRFDPHAVPKTGKPPFMPALARSQFGTMIGLGIDGRSLKTGDAKSFMRSIILYLRHGMVYYHYYYPDLPETGPGSGEYGPINHMFPITPVRLFEGGIIGKERTITCVSGTYEWKHPYKPTVRVFGPDGRAKKGDFTLKRAKRTWTVELRINDWNEIAVIAE